MNSSGWRTIYKKEQRESHGSPHPWVKRVETKGWDAQYVSQLRKQYIAE